MAIDTQNKRRSAASYGGGGGIAPVADGSLDEYDRRHLTVYRGPLVAAAVFRFRAPVGVAYQLLVADNTGSVLTELKPRLEKVSWVMNEVGKLTFVMARQTQSCRSGICGLGIGCCCSSTMGCRRGAG